MQEPYEQLLIMQDNAEKAQRAAANVQGYLDRFARTGKSPSPIAGDMTMTLKVSVTWLSDMLDAAYSEGDSGG
jgi:hypothetical protein